MKLQFRSSDLEGQQWRRRTANTLRRALGHLHGLVARMRVRLDDVNGPAGGVDKRCKVEVLVQGSTPLAISATARTWQASVEAVAARLRQAVVLRLRREAHRPRPVRSRHNRENSKRASEAGGSIRFMPWSSPPTSTVSSSNTAGSAAAWSAASCAAFG